MNLQEAPTAIKAYMAAGIPPFLWGAPGVGKSDVVRAIAAEENKTIVDFRAVLRDPVDLRGLPSIDGDTARWLPPGDLPNEERDGKEGILFMDELNAAPASVQAACFGLVLDRKVGEYKLPDGWKIIAAGNRQSDRAAAQRMPSALANRFAHIDIEPDHEAFCVWANENDIDPMLIAFIRFRPNLLHSMDETNLRAFPSPRSWANCSKLTNDTDVDPTLMLPLVQGLVGDGAASEFMAFYRVANELPSLSYVLANPNNCKVPTDPGARYAIACGLARVVKDNDSFSQAIKYIQRVGAEYEQMLVVDAVKLNHTLSHTQAFVDWSVRNQDVNFA